MVYLLLSQKIPFVKLKLTETAFWQLGTVTFEFIGNIFAIKSSSLENHALVESNLAHVEKRVKIPQLTHRY